MIDPIVFYHQMEDAVKQSDISSWLDRKQKVTGPSDWSNPGIDDDHFGAILACLPNVIRRDRSTFSDIRSAYPYDFRLEDVAPWIGCSIDAKSLLISGACAHHAQPAIVIRKRRL